MNLKGIKTWLPSELRKQDFVSSTLVDLYTKQGFEEISIPSLVDLQVISKTNSKFSNEVFKLVDKDGRVLALRTEMTQPIARLVATRASELEFPLKLFYDSSIFRYKGVATDDSREIRQVGIEHIGDAESDIETVKLILDSVKQLSIKNYRLSITDAGIWRAIIVKYPGLGARLYDMVLTGDLISFKKHIFADHPLLALLTADVAALESCLGLDLSKIRKLVESDEAIVFDPLQCPDLNLYTGLHFNLHVEGQGKLLARGGRYDNLLKEFGKDLPAIGFAFYLPRLMSVMADQGLLPDQDKSDIATNKVLKIALSKGTLLEGALDFFKAKGLNVEITNKRKLVVDAGPGLGFDKVELLLVRGHDVPTYVEHGAADLGVVGLDTVIDSNASLVKLKDLDYGHCRLCVCAKNGLYKSVADLPTYARVATTFPNLTNAFFAQKGLEVEVINLYGSVELGPLTELSDVIVDLVATGATLKENGLEIIEEIMPCSAVLVANNSSFKVFKQEFLDLT
ncbi:MAG: ATP phosphoribosyltransferase [Cyanobacteria bacterium]|nr:ATP phosphoribosyltransferase [Cyanobacteriota bacterium]MDA1019956.1 ATP phosphoribosyltransferase [Cyanobacteriota bacterium]